MFTLTELNKLIPYGKRKEIAVKAGVSCPAVSKFLSGKVKSSHRIQVAAMEVALECAREKRELENQLKKVL